MLLGHDLKLCRLVILGALCSILLWITVKDDSPSNHASGMQMKFREPCKSANGKMKCGGNRVATFHNGTVEDDKGASITGTSRGESPFSTQQDIEPSPYGGLFDYVAPEHKPIGRAYWMGSNEVTAVLLRSTSYIRPKTCSCGSITTTSMASKTGLGEAHGATFVPVVVSCYFDKKVLLKACSDETGELILGDAVIPVYNRRPKLRQPFKFALCIPCLHPTPRYVWVNQWMHYYLLRLKTDHFFIYSAIEGQTAMKLRDQGVLLAPDQASVLNIASQQRFKPYYFGQTFAMHDCLYMNRHLDTEWVMFQDVDEILSVPGKFQTPYNFFQSYPSYTALTFGSWPIDVTSCRPESAVHEKEKLWPLISRMQKHSAQPSCFGGMCRDCRLCPDWPGRRKYALRPRKHCRLFIHNPTEGVVHHLPTTKGFLHHVANVTDMRIEYCKRIEKGTASNLITQGSIHG